MTWVGHQADGWAGCAGAAGATGEPHDGQNAFPAGTAAPHAAQASAGGSLGRCGSGVAQFRHPVTRPTLIQPQDGQRAVGSVGLTALMVPW